MSGERLIGLARAEGLFQTSASRRSVEVPVERQQEVAPSERHSKQPPGYLAPAKGQPVPRERG